MNARIEKKESCFHVNDALRDVDAVLSVLESYCENWDLYLSEFQNVLGSDMLPFDNEMSIVGSLADSISRYNKDCFVVHEANIDKHGNQATSGGRSDLLVYSSNDKTEVYIEAKRHRKAIKSQEELVDVFSKSETSDNIRSLIGKGFRDFTKTTGKVHRIRSRGHVMMLLAHLQFSEEFSRADAISQVGSVFKGMVVIRKTNAPGSETSRKNMAKRSTLGFLFVPDTPSSCALLATMTIL